MKDLCCILRTLDDRLLQGGERLFMRIFKCSSELTNVSPSAAELFYTCELQWAGEVLSPDSCLWSFLEEKRSKGPCGFGR